MSNQRLMKQGSYFFEFFKFHDFFHDLFYFSITLGLAVTFETFENFTCFSIFLALKQFNRNRTETNSGIHQNACRSRCLITPLYLTLSLLCHLQYY